MYNVSLLFMQIYGTRNTVESYPWYCMGICVFRIHYQQLPANHQPFTLSAILL